MYPDLSGTWNGNLTIKVLTGAIAPSMICVHQWTIGSSADGKFSGTWQSSPDGALPFLAVPACQQSGQLSGTITPSGAITLSFNATLTPAGCSGGNDAVSGTLSSGTLSASAQDTIACGGVPSEPRSLTFSMYRQ